MSRLLPHDRCPACGHDLDEHYLDFGCLKGWEWADGVVVSEEGCDCSLTLCRGRGGRPFEGDR
jgi:hypothetical protein